MSGRQKGLQAMTREQALLSLSGQAYHQKGRMALVVQGVEETKGKGKETGKSNGRFKNTSANAAEGDEENDESP
eukprot:9040617-Prorocentrum_lima.AAC.1